MVDNSSSLKDYLCQ